MFDLICMGRASIDLFAKDIGVPFEDVTGFHAFVGGTPLNIAVGVQRLGLQTAMLTGTSDDGVGRLVRKFLTNEGVSTAHMIPKHDKHTNAFMLSIQPPNQFEAVAYQARSADLWLNIDDVLAAPIATAKAILFTGMGWVTPTNKSATLIAAEMAITNNVKVFMDIDFKDHQWPDPRVFGIFTRTGLPLVDVALGTEDEICAAASLDEPEAAAKRLLGLVREAIVVKRGARGASVLFKDGSRLDSPVYPSEVLNVFGAGDAFAAGLIYGRLSGMDWEGALQIAAACGALIVMKHGCANDMPTRDEVDVFLAGR